MIKFLCSNCGHGIGAPDKYAGKRVRCPKCQKGTQVPAAGGGAGAEKGSVIKFRCPKCNQKIGVSREYAGKRVRCAKCKNPMRVPGGAKAASRPAAEDATKVLRAGHEQKAAEPWGDMGSINELLATKSSAPSLELQKEEGAADYGDGEVDLSAYGVGPAGPLLSTAGGVAGEGGGKSHKGLFIGAACVAGVLVLGVVAWFLAGSGGGEAAGQGELADAKRFGQEYIVLLEAGRIERATELLSEQVRGDVEKDEMERLVRQVGKSKIISVECTTTHVEEGPDGTEFYLEYDITHEQEIQSVVTSLSKVDGDFRVGGIAVLDELGNTVAIGASSFEELSAPILASQFAKFGGLIGRFFCGFMLVLLVLALVVVVSMWIVFEKAGHPGWAAIVPIYNVWVLAEVGDRPGWWGLAAALSGGIPYVGPVVQLVLWITIYVGVAKAFGRGVLFGLGLCFLPFVFFPVLAFSSD
jgi:DNA-directed RNA polymerase subunit RPC12/RpoP